jgi:hypothetical protein
MTEVQVGSYLVADDIVNQCRLTKIPSDQKIRRWDRT